MRADEDAGGVLPAEVAQTVVEHVMARLGSNVNIMDLDGRIIASGDRDRLGQVHEGARQAVRSGREVSVDSRDAARLPGTRPGVNVPIAVDGRTVGVVGVTGDPQDVLKVAASVSLTVELMLQQEASQQEWQWRDRACAQLLEDLAGQRLDEPAWRRRLGLAGCHPRPPYLVLAWFLDGTAPVGHERRRLGLAGPHAFVAVDTQDVVWTVAGDGHHAAVRRLLADARRRLSRAGTGGHVLDGGTAADLGALGATVRRLRLVPAPAVTEDGTLGDHELAVLLAGVPAPDRGAARRRLVGGLDDDLVTTLTVFLEQGMRVSRTAAALVVHRNTVLNRLDRIAAATGRDPRVFADAAALHVGLQLARQDG